MKIFTVAVTILALLAGAMANGGMTLEEYDEWVKKG